MADRLLRFMTRSVSVLSVLAVGHLDEENKELKGLLKLIYDEMQEEKRCWTCEYKKSSGADRVCYKCSYSEKSMYKWKHTDEVMKLLQKKVRMKKS